MPRPSKRRRGSSASVVDENENRSNAQHSRQAQLNRIPARQSLPLRFSAVHHLKPFTAKCSKCGAKHWLEEKRSGSSMQYPEFSMCCAQGKVSLPAPVYPPVELATYLLDQTQGECSFFLPAMLGDGLRFFL
jgi:hypothetical protein